MQYLCEILLVTLILVFTYTGMLFYTIHTRVEDYLSDNINGLFVYYIVFQYYNLMKYDFSNDLLISFYNVY